MVGGLGGPKSDPFADRVEDELAPSERVVPRAVRERSERARSANDLPPGEKVLVPGEVRAFRGQFADVLSGCGVVRCTLRGRLETADSEFRTLLAVGDRVEFSRTGESEGAVERILSRGRSLVRRDRRVARFRHVIAANVGRVLLVTSVREPKFRPGIVDRFLVAASSQGLSAFLVINKTDLAASEQLARELVGHRSLYEGVGVRTLLTSAVTGSGLDDLASFLSEGRTVLVGHSGVGKSTLLNRLDPGLELPARAVNRRTGKGVHTTSVAELLRLSSGAEVIDTPGIRELDIIDLASVDLEAHFPEFLPLLEKCDMDNCAHREEPGCAVREAVEEGRASPRRYESYLAIRRELEAAERPYAS
jgi:ribosome biogenesis GTPase